MADHSTKKPVAAAIDAQLEHIRGLANQVDAAVQRATELVSEGAALEDHGALADAGAAPTPAPAAAGPDLEELDCLVSKASAIAVLISADRGVSECHQNAAWAITDFLAHAREILRPVLEAGRLGEARHG